MRFQVPQFIEREARVIGPLTFKQFIYLAVPGAIAFFLYFTMPFYVFLFGAIALGMIGFGLGFVKIGGRSLPEMLLNMFSFSAAPKNYIWKKESGRAAVDTMKEYKQTEQEAEIAKQIQLKKK